MTRSLSEFRNVALVGHPSAGKTTLVDALAFVAGVTDRKGSVSQGTSLCDTEPEAQEKGHTLQLAVLECQHGGRTWSFIDTPGYPDFEADAHAGLYAADLVLGVVSAAGPVPHDLRRSFEVARQLGRPRALLMTHLDADPGAFEGRLGELREAFGEFCAPVLWPRFDGQSLAAVERVMTDPAHPWRKALMDRVMDGCEDEEMVGRYLETEQLSEEELRDHYPTALAAGTLVPILVCNPVTDVGVREVLEFLHRAAPGPDTQNNFTAGGEAVPCDPEGELVGVVFAVRSDPHVGKLCYVRILSGTLGHHDHVAGQRGGHDEKLGGLFRLVGGRRRDPLERLAAGGIGCFTKVEQLRVGETFGRPGADLRAVDFVTLPRPMVAVAARPAGRADETKLGAALHKLEAEDPSFQVAVDPVTHELVLTGSSELHLQVMQARLERRFHVAIETKPPRIAYRETIRRPAEAQYRHKKQSGGRGQFGEVHLRVRPGAQGSGLVFQDGVVGGAIPRNLIPAVERGVRELAGQGILTHSQVVDVEVEVYDGKFHAVDSDEASFKIAGARAFREAFQAAQPTLLEPVMEVEVRVPTESAGPLFSDLTAHRRAQVLDQQSEDHGHWTVIRAHVPQATLQTFHRDLKSMTGGAGTWSMSLAHYSPVAPAEQQRVLAEQARSHDES
jgi:elongation factor G